MDSCNRAIQPFQYAFFAQYFEQMVEAWANRPPGARQIRRHRVHPRLPGQVSHRLMPNAEYHEVLAEDRMDLDIAFEDWEKKEGLLAVRSLLDRGIEALEGDLKRVQERPPRH